ncbi:MAG: hypothetical protein CMC48_10725 [Flavobacteriaceae bacterium]|nr:hypothetical protein [Flavobacteriaceae bacterium]|tara:strand:- start:36 stop:530 length:495 start_codon:yes stop_codon:yes gene_type:complete
MSRVDFPNRLNKTRRQLNHILNDHRYYQPDSTREFTVSMYNAFGKRKITPKMEISMDKIIAQYIKWQTSENKLDKYKKLENIEDGTYKLNLIRTLLSGCGYQPGYVGRSTEFLDSIEKQLRFNGMLSKKQKMALNQMYKRFKSRCESRGIHDVKVEQKLPSIEK